MKLHAKVFIFLIPKTLTLETGQGLYLSEVGLELVWNREVVHTGLKRNCVGFYSKIFKENPRLQE